VARLLIDGPVWIVDHLGPAIEATVEAVNAFERWLWRILGTMGASLTVAGLRCPSLRVLSHP
jgi:hypothetical protein